jgi:hypothetical protein
MKKIIFLCLIALGMIFTSCNKQPRQLKLTETQEIYSFIEENFYITKTINDSMGFAANDYGISSYFSHYDKEPECVIITNELCYDDRLFYTYKDEGLWITIGTWKENNKTYPVIKFHEFDSVELIVQKILSDTLLSSYEEDSIFNEYKDKAYFLKCLTIKSN